MVKRIKVITLGEKDYINFYLDPEGYTTKKLGEGSKRALFLISLAMAKMVADNKVSIACKIFGVVCKAYFTPTYFTVYGDTKSQLKKLLRQALKFITKDLGKRDFNEKLRAYLATQLWSTGSIHGVQISEIDLSSFFEAIIF